MKKCQRSNNLDYLNKIYLIVIPCHLFHIKHIHQQTKTIVLIARTYVLTSWLSNCMILLRALLPTSSLTSDVKTSTKLDSPLYYSWLKTVFLVDFLILILNFLCFPEVSPPCVCVSSTSLFISPFSSLLKNSYSLLLSFLKFMSVLKSCSTQADVLLITEHKTDYLK